ncbi:hypothetical protein IH979_02825 [Patescibacteria group bacterium]|nr:hypothetical protein [Patescibacteria group bacterium]
MLDKAIGKFQLSGFLGLLIKWYVFVLFLTPSAALVKLPALSSFLLSAALWIPNLIAAVLVALVGLIAADYVALKVRETKIKSSGIVASVAKIVIIVFTLIIALGQISIDVSVAENSFLVILAGILQLKDAFWYGRGPSLTIFPSAAKRIELYVKKVSKRLSTAFFLGMFVALVELPCTGAVYIAVLALMSLSGFTFSTITSLILYNAVFVLPLFVILFAVYKGANTRRLELWREKYRSLMRLAIGLLLIGLGVWMIIFVF